MNRFSVLVSNFVLRNSLRAANGLSLFIQSDDKSILFDTGPDDLFIRNGNFMNIPFHFVDSVVVSHLHIDHTGGLRYLEKAMGEMKSALRIVVPEDIESPAKVSHRGHVRSIGCPVGKSELSGISQLSVLGISQVLYPGVTVFHTETTEGLHELSLIVNSTLFVGCAHTGVEKIVQSAVSAGNEIKTVVGGMHLFNSEQRNVRRIAESLNKSGIERVIALHCSGFQWHDVFAAAGIDYSYGPVGGCYSIL